MQNSDPAPEFEQSEGTGDVSSEDTASGSAQADDMPNRAEAASDVEDVNQLKTDLAAAQDRLLRAQAELENYRKRVQREQEETVKFESFRLVRDLLPPLDSLGLAMNSAAQSGDFQSLLDGIQMVNQQFLDVLKAHSVEPIPAEGKPFDPNLHEALSQIPAADVEPMTVIQVVETGYRLHDRVVRPARVIVACEPPAE
jgi:molecular chaperone GrpE